MITTINGKEYSITIDAGFLEIEFDNEITGLRTVYVFKDLSIGAVALKRVETIYHSYDITPTGLRINERRHAYKISESDFNEFESEAVGQILKRSIVNGLFRFVLQIVERVFDPEDGTLIEVINTQNQE